MKRPPGSTGMPALVGLLLVVFAIAGLLVYEAWSTGRSRREIAERGLQDYAAYASWSTARAGENSLAASLSTLFRGLIGDRDGANEPIPSLRALLNGATYLRECDCAIDIPADYYFRYDARDGTLERVALPQTTNTGPEPGWAAAKVGSYTPASSSSAVNDDTAWLKESLARITGRSIPSFAVFFDDGASAKRVIGLAPQRDAERRVIGALGFVADPKRFADATFSQLWRNSKILPYAITRGVPSDSLLAATVTTPGGTEIYRSKSWSADLRSDTASLGIFGGGMRVRIGLRSDATLRLQGGIVPVSRVPVWVGLLLLTGLLTVLVVRNLQREHELSRLRLEFSASVSHELRTPLSQILLFGETLMLNRTRSDSERSTAASVIVREARRLMHLVDNTLTFSRAERPVASLSPQQVTLAPIVREVIAGFAPLANARSVTITDDLDPHAHAFVDPAAFGQMVLNLLDNAVKYGPVGQKVTVTLTAGHTAPRAASLLAGPKSAHRPTVQLTVDDQGPGVPGPAREEVWIAFSRGVNGERPVGTGCGLGLAVVRELAERHDGTAWVEVAPGGRGSRFVIELPETTLARHQDAEIHEAAIA
ncbi:MAG TPA: HAMP domain-containing sensor histidine kinase [Gemmatimonadaceae bacterium]|nr:HAMP domain-containing sensor histidine kinase [Gemmatimonadaceae bacterium]